MNLNSPRAASFVDYRNSIICGAVFACFYALFHGGFSPASLSAALLVWGDGLAISGILLLLITGARALNRDGAIVDWVGYTLYLARFLFSKEKDEAYTSFHDYRLLKERSSSPLQPWVLVGCAILFAGVVLSFLYKSF